jgi:hypothetical protein
MKCNFMKSGFVKMYSDDLNLITLAFSEMVDSNFGCLKVRKSEYEPFHSNMNITLTYAVLKSLHSSCTQLSDMVHLPRLDCHTCPRMNSHQDGLTNFMNYVGLLSTWLSL